MVQKIAENDYNIISSPYISNEMSYEDDDDVERQVMGIINKDNCVGCEACAKICPKGCYTNVPLAI